MTMMICDSCGAQQITLGGRWQGGDQHGCDHFFYSSVPSSRLEAEIKMLLATYPAYEVYRAAQRLCRA